MTIVDSLAQVVRAYTDYLKVAEEEKTKRREIQAWEKTELAKIKAIRVSLITYLDKSFDERQKNFQMLFTLIDKAMETGDNKKLASLLDSLVELGKSSPFKDLADTTKVKAYLDDPDHIWEI